MLHVDEIRGHGPQRPPFFLSLERKGPFEVARVGVLFTLRRVKSSPVNSTDARARGYLLGNQYNTSLFHAGLAQFIYFFRRGLAQFIYHNSWFSTVYIPPFVRFSTVYIPERSAGNLSLFAGKAV